MSKDPHGRVEAGAAPSTEPASFSNLDEVLKSAPPALLTTLYVAVPLWIERMMPRPWDFIHQRAMACGQVIAEHGDDIMFRGHKIGDTAVAFNALAEGLAALSFAPGGVKFMGAHWETKRQAGSWTVKREGSGGEGQR